MTSPAPRAKASAAFAALGIDIEEIPCVVATAVGPPTEADPFWALLDADARREATTR